jgi:hypothetical protein
MVSEANFWQREEQPTIRPELIKMGDVRDEPVRNPHDHCTRGQMSISFGERLIVPALLGWDIRISVRWLHACGKRCDPSNANHLAILVCIYLRDHLLHGVA